MSDVVITVDTPSKNGNRRLISGDEAAIVPSNLGSDENLLASDALNEESQNEPQNESQNESHWKKNSNNLGPNSQSNEAANSQLSITEAGLSARCGFSSLQVPFSLGRSSKDGDSICTAQSHIMSGEKFDPTTQW